MLRSKLWIVAGAALLMAACSGKEKLPEENFLILGDCTGGTFPDWDFDEVLGCRLAETIKEIGPEVCLPGHWTPLDTEIIIKDLLDGEG